MKPVSGSGSSKISLSVSACKEYVTDLRFECGKHSFADSFMCAAEGLVNDVLEP